MSEAPLDHISGRFAAPVMRSVMTVPVIVERFIEKAPSAGADVICLDLEDSVPPAEKAAARPLARKAIETMPRAGYLMYARVNGIWSGLIEGDLEAIVTPGLDGVVISKAESSDMIREIDSRLAQLESERGIEPGAIAIMPLIETAKGVAKCYEICEASPRLTGAIFGAEDYATDMGIERTPEGAEILWARTQIAIACRAAGIEGDRHARPGLHRRRPPAPRDAPGQEPRLPRQAVHPPAAGADRQRNLPPGRGRSGRSTPDRRSFRARWPSPRAARRSRWG